MFFIAVKLVVLVTPGVVALPMLATAMLLPLIFRLFRAAKSPIVPLVKMLPPALKVRDCTAGLVPLIPPVMLMLPALVPASRSTLFPSCMPPAAMMLIS